MAHVSPTVRASTTTWAQLLTGGMSIVLDKQITANALIANPSSQCTVNVTGGGSSGGSLAAGAYYASYTWTNGFGETTVGSGRSNQFTISATNIPRITIPSLPTGAVAANIYLTAVAGAAGSETLYTTGVTGTTYDASAAAGEDSLVAVPSANTTAMSNVQALVLMGKQRQLQDLYDAANRLVHNYISGRPIALNQAKLDLAKYAAVFQALATALNEINVLVRANTGTLTTTTNAAGERVPVRTFS